MKTQKKVLESTIHKAATLHVCGSCKYSIFVGEKYHRDDLTQKKLCGNCYCVVPLDNEIEYPLMNKMTYEKFKEKFVETNKMWKFDLFKIVCRKCESEKVEFNSDMELEEGYYNSFSVEGKIIVKCHSCGNAFALDFGSIEQ